MNIQTFCTKVSEYVSTVLVGKASSWESKFALGAASVLIPPRVESVVRSMGVVSESGEVDVNALHSAVAFGFKSAGHVDLFGGVLGFDPQDAEDFFSFLSR